MDIAFCFRSTSIGSLPLPRILYTLPLPPPIMQTEATDAQSELAAEIAVAPIDPDFDNEDADIVVLSSPGDLPQMLFKVHKCKLAAISPVFSDGLELGSATGRDQAGEAQYRGLPVVKLGESSDELGVLLAYSYNGISRFPELDVVPWKTTLALWETSIKYAMAVVQALVEQHILHL